jgi:3-keto-disaccharide hydrolase
MHQSAVAPKRKLKMKSSRAVACATIACSLTIAALARSAEPASVDTMTLSPMPPRILPTRNVSAFTENNGWNVLRLDEQSGDGLAWWPDTNFANGTIEFDVRGKDQIQRSFLGIAFHGVDGSTYEAVYFRPFNFQADDPLRRSHGVQYISHPTFTWSKLRAERPGHFEHEISPGPNPNGWFHARVLVEYPSVRVFVNGQQEPSLDVKQLSDRKSGWIGIWTGNGSGGDFANIRVSSAP